MNWFKVVLVCVLSGLLLYTLYNLLCNSIVKTDEKQINQTIVTNTTQKSKKWFPKIFARLHGTVLVVGWMALIPIATLIARYHRSDLNLFHLGFGQIWFQIHRISLYISLILNVFGAIFIYMRIGGWSGIQFHTVLGVISMLLIGVQAFIATYYRPSLLSRNRKLFNWSHFLIGNSSFICAVITIYCALDYRMIKERRTQILWLLNALIAIFVLKICFFESKKYYQSFVKRRHTKSDSTAMEELKTDIKSEKSSYELTAKNPIAIKLLILQMEIIAITVITTAICVYILDDIK